MNDWVRMTRGHHKGDLALVVDVKDGGLKAVIQCVPRLDLALATMNPDEARVRRRTVRPPQKFFSASEVRALGRHTQRQRFPGGVDNCDYFEGSYFHDGYLLKEVTVGSMIKPCTDEDPPSLDELQRFRKRKKTNADGFDDGEDENEGSRIANSLLDELSELQGRTGISTGASNGGLIIGDTVEVVEGDLVGMRGKLLSVDGTTVKVQPSNAGDLAGMNEIEFLTSQLRKFIPVGAHVRVTDGRYSGETGVVVAIEALKGETDCSAVVMTDMTHKEVSGEKARCSESWNIRRS
jgi:transcription elongation factor SPT5